MGACCSGGHGNGKGQRSTWSTGRILPAQRDAALRQNVGGTSCTLFSALGQMQARMAHQPAGLCGPFARWDATEEVEGRKGGARTLHHLFSGSWQHHTAIHWKGLVGGPGRGGLLHRVRACLRLVGRLQVLGTIYFASAWLDESMSHARPPGLFTAQMNTVQRVETFQNTFLGVPTTPLTTQGSVAPEIRRPHSERGHGTRNLKPKYLITVLARLKHDGPLSRPSQNGSEVRRCLHFQFSHAFLAWRPFLHMRTVRKGVFQVPTDQSDQTLSGNLPSP